MNSLKAFEAVSRHMSVNAAAKELSVSHGAVSQQIRALERFLGRDLFVRAGNTLRLTEQGASYAKTVQKALALVSAHTARLTERPEALKLRISAPPTFAVRWLISRLPKFHAANPDIEISLDVSAKVASLGPQGVDAAIRFGATRDKALSYIELLTPDIVMVASATYLKKYGHIREFGQLSDHKLIAFNAGSRPHAALHVSWCDVVEPAPAPAHEFAEEHLAGLAPLWWTVWNFRL